MTSEECVVFSTSYGGIEYTSTPSAELFCAGTKKRGAGRTGRTAKRQKGEARLMRGWLMAGLAMIMIGGAAMGLTQTVSDQKQTYYQYLSEGVIREGEALNIFEHLEHGEATAEQSHQLAKRINFDYRTTTDFRGTVFIEQVEGGLRRYHVYADGVEVNVSPFKWLLLPSSIMLLFGGLGCFYIARRWR